MTGIEYITEDLSTHPQCAHGPTLLFSRSTNTRGDRRRFFACAACRDRRECSFFLWADEINRVSDGKRHAWEVEREKNTPNIDHNQRYDRLHMMRKRNECARHYCNVCQVLVPDEDLYLHVEHYVKIGVLDKEIDFPSTFLTPLSDDKKEAQYFFCNTTISAIINILNDQQTKNVLCIGAPRVHENIVNNYKHMTSLLLDLDHRYHTFYGPSDYCWYNLFNHHFFFPAAKEVFSEFLKLNNGEGLAIIMDPPFGGRTEPMAQTLNAIQEEYQTANNTTKKIPVYLFFPYFNEPQILNTLPDLRMADYKVDYANHELFRSALRVFGSPIRMFTNVPLEDIALPGDEGYRYCEPCKRWVYQENKHCKQCNSCTSKDGRTYVHCKVCQRCVKPTWGHCDMCNKCAQPDHICEELPFNQECYNCKKVGHKKENCPECPLYRKIGHKAENCSECAARKQKGTKRKASQSDDE